MKKKDLSGLRDAKLRAEPDYKGLCSLLDQQTDAQKARLVSELSQSQRCEPSQNKGAKDMEDKTRALDPRIMELKAEGLSFSQVADRLNAEGFKNQAGGTFTRKSVAGRYYRFKGKEPSQDSQGCDSNSMVEHPATAAKPCEDSSRLEDHANDATQCDYEGTDLDLAKDETGCEPCDDTTGNQQEPLSSEHSQPCEASQSALPPEMVQAVRALVREELAAMSAEVANIAKAAKDDVEMPPPTPKAEGSKRFLGERVTMPGMRIDITLYAAFKEECKALGLSASDGLQRILWLHFDRPRLSFELAELHTAEQPNTGHHHVEKN